MGVFRSEQQLVVERRGGVVRTLFVGALMVVGGFTVAQLAGILPSLHNPFGTTTVDRSQPAILKAVADISEYHAATGNFQVVVDLEKDARYMPDFLRGQRTLFVASGTVDAYLDFGTLDDDAIAVSDDGKSVTVTLPHAQLSEARLDPEASKVVTRERGLLDRLGGVFSDTPTGEQQLYVLAEKKVEAAARAGGVRARAEENTRAMLEGLLESLGFEQVSVVFGNPAT